MKYGKIITSSLAVSFMLLGGLGVNARYDGGNTAENADTVKALPDTAAVIDENSIIDEVIWVVGDEPILKSDVEAIRMQGEVEGVKWKGNPDCAIPEQIAVQKLFLHQAAIDSIEVTESEVVQSVDQQINYWIQAAGGKEKLEEYKKQSITAMRQSMRDDFRDRQLIEKMKDKLVSDITVSPADVRRFFKDMPEDSIPLVPTEVEVQIITKSPKVTQEEINRVKDELRNYTDRVTNGETSFSTLARLYSEDPGTARLGGEFDDYVGRGLLDPAFAAVAFNLTDPKKISKIVETEFGYHIIQLVDKRGDKIKVRHILRKPHISQEAVTEAEVLLDSVATNIREGKYTFDDAAVYVSDDKDTRNNHGLMANSSEAGRTSKFRMQDLPPEIAKVVDTLKVGEMSRAFNMIDSRGKRVCVIAKLKSRVESHRATITEDFQVLKNEVLAKRREEFIKEWIQNKLKTTYVRMNNRYKDCDFEYQGWIK